MCPDIFVLGYNIVMPKPAVTMTEKINTTIFIAT